MDTKKTQTLKRLLKKLSALRATLSDDEQAVLDQIIFSQSADVEAHRQDPRLDPRLDPRYDPRLDPRLDPKAQPGTDVEAHRLDPRLDHVSTHAWTPKPSPVQMWKPIVWTRATTTLRPTTRPTLGPQSPARCRCGSPSS